MGVGGRKEGRRGPKRTELGERETIASFAAGFSGINTADYIM